MGAQIYDVFLVFRTWSGERVGDGSFTDDVTQIEPTPCIKDYSHDVRITEVGAVKAGDIIVTGISQNQYPDELALRTDTVEKNTQKIYHIGKHFYHVVNIRKKLLTWNIHLRKIRQDETEER